MSSIKKNIKKYLNTNSNINFREVFHGLREIGNPDDLLEEICLSKKIKQKAHLGEFYTLKDRFLEAYHYIKLHIEEYPTDVTALGMLQYIAARRGDFKASAQACNQLSKLEVKDTILLRAYLIHSITFGPREWTIVSVNELFKHKNLDENTILIIFEALMNTEDYYIFSELVNYNYGRELITNASKRNNSHLRRILITRLSKTLIDIGEIQNG